MATKKLKLDALIRVSRKDGREGDSFRSPRQQQEICEQWAAANDAEVVEWHEGIGRSGKTMDRADVAAALEQRLVSRFPSERVEGRHHAHVHDHEVGVRQLP